MSFVKLKKILKREEVDSILKDSIEALDTPINIFDTEGNLLLGQFNPDLSHQFIIKTGYQVIGWLKGDEKAAHIAKLVNYIANQETEKKSLAFETLERYEEINFLYDISAKIAKCLEVDEVITIIIYEVKKLIEATHVSVMLINPDTGELEAISPDSHQEKVKTIRKLGITYHVLQSGRAEIVNDVLSDPRYVPGKTQIRSLICAPLTSKNETIGVINISHTKPLKYKAEDLKLFTALTSQTAAAIQIAQYYKKLKDYSQTLEQKVTERTLELEKAKHALEIANLELQKLATLDQLTKLANRRKFDEYFEREWRGMYRDRHPLSIIFCDVDYFKLYNDCYGHPAGDECLKKVARSLQKVVKRAGDLVARYGGEEFVIILSNTDLGGAIQIAQKIQTAIRQLKIPHRLSTASEFVTLSLGVASMIPTADHDGEILIKAADVSLYNAKNSGRNCYSVQKIGTFN